VPTYAAVPSACPPAPYYAAPQQYAMPQQYTVPQYAAPQYAVAQPSPVFSEAACGSPYVTEMGCGVPYTSADPSCGYFDGGYGMPSQQMMIDPGPAP
jgi:hypothetical protein